MIWCFFRPGVLSFAGQNSCFCRQRKSFCWSHRSCWCHHGSWECCSPGENLFDLSDWSCAYLSLIDISTGPFQTYLDAFMEAASSPFGFLMVSGSVAVATTKWWEMNAMERVVLTLLVSSLPTCSSRDVPVFLPVTSPKVCVWCTLLPAFSFTFCFGTYLCCALVEYMTLSHWMIWLSVFAGLEFFDFS